MNHNLFESGAAFIYLPFAINWSFVFAINPLSLLSTRLFLEGFFSPWASVICCARSDTNCRSVFQTLHAWSSVFIIACVLFHVGFVLIHLTCCMPGPLPPACSEFVVYSKRDAGRVMVRSSQRRRLIFFFSFFFLMIEVSGRNE